MRGRVSVRKARASDQGEIELDGSHFEQEIRSSMSPVKTNTESNTKQNTIENTTPWSFRSPTNVDNRAHQHVSSQEVYPRDLANSELKHRLNELELNNSFETSHDDFANKNASFMCKVYS